MSVYSFVPFEVINSIDSHTGWHVASAVIIFACILYIYFLSEELSETLMTLFISAVAILILGAISYNSGVLIVPKNEQVVGTLSGFVAEGFAEQERSGKHTRVVERHYTYVVYEVPEGKVVLRSNEGTTYPKTAILYKQ